MIDYEEKIKEKLVELGFYYDSHSYWVKPFDGGSRLNASFHKDNSESRGAKSPVPMITIWFNYPFGMDQIDYAWEKFDDLKHNLRRNAIEYQLTLGYDTFMECTTHEDLWDLVSTMFGFWDDKLSICNEEK